MTAIIEKFLQCDGKECRKTFGLSMRSMNIGYHRKQAKKEGWTYRKGKDYCENCSKERIIR